MFLEIEYIKYILECIYLLMQVAQQPLIFWPESSVVHYAQAKQTAESVTWFLLWPVVRVGRTASWIVLPPWHYSSQVDITPT